MQARKLSKCFCVSSDIGLAKFTRLVFRQRGESNTRDKLVIIRVAAEEQTYTRHNNTTFAHRVTNDRYQSVRIMHAVMWTRVRIIVKGQR